MSQRRRLLDPIPPGEILREEFMRPLGISINALARALAVPANRIRRDHQRQPGDHGRYRTASR
jgi:addiction module HigA family antidote